MVFVLASSRRPSAGVPAADQVEASSFSTSQTGSVGHRGDALRLQLERPPARHHHSVHSKVLLTLIHSFNNPVVQSVLPVHESL